MYQSIVSNHRYLDQKWVKVFLYLSDDVFVPTNWLFLFSHEVCVLFLPTNLANYHELYINDNENNNLLKQFNQSKFSWW